MRVRPTHEYRQNLADIVNWLRAKNPAVARRVTASIRAASRRLEDHPLSGREQSNGSRKLIVIDYGYLIYYGVDMEKDIVSLFSIQHGSQERQTSDT